MPEHRLAFTVAALLLSACGSDPFQPAAHPPYPVLEAFSDKARLAPLRLITITAANEPLADSLNAFSDALVASDWWKKVTPEYQTGSVSANLHIQGKALSGAVDPTALLDYIARTAADAGMATDGNTLFLIYGPPGASNSPDGSPNDQCQSVGGYHFPYRSRGDQWAWVQRCPPPGLSELDALTDTASHEVHEAITNPGIGGYAILHPVPPWSGSVWGSVDGNSPVVETGDLCNGTGMREGRWHYQRVWSNVAAASAEDPCAPAAADPWFSVSAPAGWYAIAAGATVEIPLTGFSAAKVADWSLRTDGDVADFAAELVSDTHESQSALARPTINNARHAILRVTARGASGRSRVISIESFRTSATGAPPTDGNADELHFWPVGVHIVDH